MKNVTVLVGRGRRKKTKRYRTAHLTRLRRQALEGRKEEARAQAAVDRRNERANRKLEAAMRGCAG